MAPAVLCSIRAKQPHPGLRSAQQQVPAPAGRAKRAAAHRARKG